MPSISEKHLKNIALFFVLLLPASLFIGSTLVEICMAGVGCTFLARSFIARDFGWLNATWVKAAIIFWGYIALRSLFTPDFTLDWERSLVASTLYFRFFLFATAIGYWVISTAKDKDKLFHAILIVALFISFNTVIQYIFATDLFGNSIDYEKYPRLVTPRGKLIVGMMLAMTLLPVISRLFNNFTLKTSNAMKLLNASIILFFTFIIFISGERTPFIIYITGVFLLIFFEPKLRKYLVHCAVIFCLLAAAVYLIKPQTIERQFGSTYNEVSNFSQSSYGASYKMAWEIFKNHPIFGVGTHNFRIECQDTKAYGSIGCYLHAHNIYLETLAENGIVGFFILISIILLWFKDAYSNFYRIRKDPLLLGAFLLVALKLLPILSGPSIHTSWAFAPFWLCLGLCYTKIWHRT